MTKVPIYYVARMRGNAKQCSKAPKKAIKEWKKALPAVLKKRLKKQHMSWKSYDVDAMGL